MDKIYWPEFGTKYVFFVDKRHCSEFGIIMCFLWIKGTVLSNTKLITCFYVDKRHSGEFGITQNSVFLFFVDKRHVIIPNSGQCILCG